MEAVPESQSGKYSGYAVVALMLIEGNFDGGFSYPSYSGCFLVYSQPSEILLSSFFHQNRRSIL